MKKYVLIFSVLSALAVSPAIAKKPGSGSWQSGESGHQLGCLILSLLGMQGCEKPKTDE
ncbi:TPA: hypothetical protein ACH2I9_004198 [Enterobacter asburiae]